MSMITEQVDNLRLLANEMDKSNYTHETSFFVAKAELRKAADTIEQLAEKAKGYNTIYYAPIDLLKNTAWLGTDADRGKVEQAVEEVEKTIKAYKKAFEDIRAEIATMSHWTSDDGQDLIMVADALECIDKYNPAQTGKEIE